MKKKNKNPIAVLTADWHLTPKAPVFRSAEPDWYEAMERPIKEIRSLSDKHGVPVLHGGDVFDKWYGAIGKNCAELINWCHKVIRFKHGIYSVPGQHDIPDHNPQLMTKSAFYTLCKMGVLLQAPPSPSKLSKTQIDLFWYGQDLYRRKPDCDWTLGVALAHQYRWIKGHSYPNAPVEGVVTRGKNMKGHLWYGYDVVVFGDNHKGFLTKIGNTTVFNCGTMMRRKSDEANYRPRVGLLYSDGSVKQHYLDTSEDRYLPITAAKEAEQIESQVDMKAFAKELSKLGASALDFAEALKQYTKQNKVKASVQKIIREAMEDGLSG